MTDLDRTQSYRFDSGVDVFRPPVADEWDWEPASRPTGQMTTRHSGLPVTVGAAGPIVPQLTDSQLSQLRYKRLLDVVISLSALLVLAPLLIICALLIKMTSRGPVFFRQKREGLNGELFEVFKFRSMHVDAGDATGVTQTVKDDPRIFPLGRFLRKTSIDELPQLLNVLRGDMSLVGPRPHVPGMFAGGVPYRDLVRYYDSRLLMLPGLTGWAQANGLRGPTDNAADAKARIDHDIAYVCNFSIWLDLKIILQTLHREFVSGSGH